MCADNLDYYRHLIDEGTAESELETRIGEGWTAKSYYEHLLEEGMVQAI